MVFILKSFSLTHFPHGHAKVIHHHLPIFTIADASLRDFVCHQSEHHGIVCWAHRSIFLKHREHLVGFLKKFRCISFHNSFLSF